MPADEISITATGANQVSRRTVIDAPAQELFDILADPRRHGALDGSGTVQDTISGPARLSEGAKFSVAMKQYGVPYRITSRVTTFEEGRLIEWRHPMGHRWRWQFVPLSPGQTEVTETFNYAGLGPWTLALTVGGFPKKNGAGIEATLRQLRSRYAR